MSDFLLIHAGVTPRDLAGIDYEGDLADARGIARAITDVFARTAANWDGETPFSLLPLYRPGSYQTRLSGWAPGGVGLFVATITTSPLPSRIVCPLLAFVAFRLHT